MLPANMPLIFLPFLVTHIVPPQPYRPGCLTDNGDMHHSLPMRNSTEISGNSRNEWKETTWLPGETETG